MASSRCRSSARRRGSSLTSSSSGGNLNIRGRNTCTPVCGGVQTPCRDAASRQVGRSPSSSRARRSVGAASVTYQGRTVRCSPCAVRRRSSARATPCARRVRWWSMPSIFMRASEHVPTRGRPRASLLGTERRWGGTVPAPAPPGRLEPGPERAGKVSRAKVPTARGRTGRDPRASPLPAPRSSALTGGIRGRSRLYGLRPAMPPVNACAADARRDDLASASPRTQRVSMSHTQRGEPAEAGCAGSPHPGPLRSLAEYGDASAHAASVRVYRQ